MLSAPPAANRPGAGSFGPHAAARGVGQRGGGVVGSAPMRRRGAAADRQAPARAVAGVSWNRGAKDVDAPIVRHAPQPRWQRLRNEKALHGTWGAGLCKWLLDLGSNQGPTD